MSDEQTRRAIYDLKSELESVRSNVSGLADTLQRHIQHMADLQAAINDLTEAVKKASE